MSYFNEDWSFYTGANDSKVVSYHGELLEVIPGEIIRDAGIETEPDEEQKQFIFNYCRDMIINAVDRERE